MHSCRNWPKILTTKKLRYEGFIKLGHCALDKASIKIETDKHIWSLIQCCHLQHMRISAAKNSKLWVKDFALKVFSFKLCWVADEMVRSGLSVSLLRYTSVPCQPMWKQMMVLKLESTWSNKLYETTTSLPKSFNYWAGNDSPNWNFRSRFSQNARSFKNTFHFWTSTFGTEIVILWKNSHTPPNCCHCRKVSKGSCTHHNTHMCREHSQYFPFLKYVFPFL